MANHKSSIKRIRQDYTTTYPIKTHKTIIRQLFQDTFAAKVHILRFFFTFW